MKDRIKTEILDKYHQLKKQLGHNPSSREFLKLADVSEKTLQKIFGSKSYSKLVKEAGDESNIFFRPGKSTDDLLIIWGGIVRKLGKIPVEADWRYHQFKPSANWFRIKFGGLPKIPEKFREFAQGKKEWEDVLANLPKPTLEQIEIKNSTVAEAEIEERSIHQFLPPI